MRVWLAVAAVVLSLGCASAQPAAPGVVLAGLSGARVTIASADLAAGPRTTVRAQVHGQTHAFEGVALTTLLARIGAPAGQSLRGEAFRQVVLVSARDGYKVAFTLAELDPAFGAAKVILADRVDGRAIPAEDGPFQLAVEGDQRAARSVRMVERIDLRRVD